MNNDCCMNLKSFILFLKDIKTASSKKKCIFVALKNQH